MTRTRPLEERFWAKVSGGSYTECWPWIAGVTSEGYGQITEGGKRGRNLLAHRVAYELMIGPIPEGLQLDHLCRVHHCVNPWHLDPVTPRVNTFRQPNSFGSRTHCPWGHPYDEANTYVWGRGRGGRGCRACSSRRHRERYQPRTVSA